VTTRQRAAERRPITVARSRCLCSTRLACNARRVIRKDKLMCFVWRDVMLTGDSLERCVCDLYHA
jgi:DNA-binding winged helix-turn-helix (wHTH) protein